MGRSCSALPCPHLETTRSKHRCPKKDIGNLEQDQDGEGSGNQAQRKRVKDLGVVSSRKRELRGVGMAPLADQKGLPRKTEQASSVLPQQPWGETAR